MERIAFERATPILTPELMERVARSRRETLAALGRAGPVYGVTTGQGHFADRALAPADAAAHQRNLLLGRAVGSAPWLPREEARALWAVRLSGFLGGRAGVSPELCAYLAARLADDLVPAVPRTAVGSAGEVIPLAHAFQVLLGEGLALRPDGSVEPAAEALRARGARPYEPGPKEGIALLAGAPGATALALARHRSAAALAGRLLWGAACAIDAAGAPVAPYAPPAGGSADPLLDRVLGRLEALLEGAGTEAGAVQGPVSFRVAPQVLAHLERALERLVASVDRALAGSDDSPVLRDGAFVSTGGFHAIDLAADMDALGAALVRAAELSAQRAHRLLDGRVTGLPDQLTPAPGPRCGMVVAHKRAVGAVNELRRLAAPASVGVADTSLGQEDAQTFAFEAAEKLRRIEALVADVLAVELLLARQAWALRGRPPAPGLGPRARALAEAVPPVDVDRPLGADIERVRDLVLAAT